MLRIRERDPAGAHIGVQPVLERVCCSFRGSVYDVGGRTVVVYPLTQIVVPMFAWVTRGSAAPGVHTGSGSTPRIWHAVDGGVVTVLAEAVAIATLAAAVAGEVAVATGVGSTAAGATVAMGDALCVASAGAVDELEVPAPRAPDVATT